MSSDREECAFFYFKKQGKRNFCDYWLHQEVDCTDCRFQGLPLAARAEFDQITYKKKPRSDWGEKRIR